MLLVRTQPPPPQPPSLAPSSWIHHHHHHNLPRSHRKRRSQSFSDYIEQRQQQNQQQRFHPHHHHQEQPQQQPQPQQLENDDEEDDDDERAWQGSTTLSPISSATGPLHSWVPPTHPPMIPSSSPPPSSSSHRTLQKTDSLEQQQQLQQPQQQQDYFPWLGSESNHDTHDTTTDDYDMSDQLSLSIQESASYHSLTLPSPPATKYNMEEDDYFENENEDTDTPPSPSYETAAQPSPSILIHILYGMINATIVIPVVMSFGAIIYQDPFFGPYAPVLIQLTMVSGVVHQLCFSTLSELPFAVGSVQDAGLIFLSGMATTMVRYCRSSSEDDTVILATVTVGLGLASLLLGCGLILLGKLQLAGYVQLLPTCVVAGYLAYIGFFCGKAGLGLMAIWDSGGGDDNADDDTTETELSLSLLIRRWNYVLPGLVGGLFIYWSVRTFRHVAVLPTCILILFLGFYTGLLVVAKSSVFDATEQGWIRKSEPAPVWYKTWDYLKLDKVVWSAFPPLALSEISMLFVVALSSSLDVAAIELELATNSLDYNKEMTMVGISNVISGATGGYTGSYIFSQSIFSLRSGITSRVAGFTLAICQILVILTPFPLLSFVPNCFYGSLLTMICLDLMIEWLWAFRTKVTTVEYVIGLSTFGMIQWLGVEYGIVAGVGMYVAGRQLWSGIPVVGGGGGGDDDCRTTKKGVGDEEGEALLETKGATTRVMTARSPTKKKVDETTPLLNTDS
jgi:MFS superfamily sulfate permease-like transporter